MNRPPEGPPQPTGLTPAAGALLGFLALIVSGFGGVGYRNPPEFSQSWAVSWLCCFAAIVVCLLISRVRSDLASRIFCSAGIVLALLGFYCPTQSYFGNFHDYPWIVLWGCAALVILGGLACRLRVVPVAFTAVLALWFGPALLPGRTKIPATQVIDGIACRLDSVDEHSCRFKLVNLKDGDLSRVIESQNVELVTSFGLSSEPEERAIPRGDFDLEPKGRSVDFAARSHRPSWARSINMRIRVQKWPTDPVISLKMPLAKLPTGGLAARSKGYRLEVSDLQWGKTQSISPPESCLRARIFFSGFSHGGLMGNEYEIADDAGNVVRPHCYSTSGSERGTEEFIEIRSPDAKTKSLTIRLFRETDIERSTIDFRFSRIGN